MMDLKENLNKIKHLYNRAGFGISYPALQILGKKQLNKTIDTLFITPNQDDDLKTISVESFRAHELDFGNLGKDKAMAMQEKPLREKITNNRIAKSKDLNTDWIAQMIVTKHPFLEKMTLFWHGHFACRSNNPYFAQQLNNIQRDNALGSFKDMLMEVSKSPAMLDYLSNQLNRKDHPNENFARELMELFTIGRGNYSEMDIREAARALTGWRYTDAGDFEFKTNIHDQKPKSFMGKTGDFDGEAIIDIILSKPETAKFICRKLYVFFVNDIPNEAHVNELAAHFYQQNYNISSVMKQLFSSAWFYSKENVGNKIKSPIELIVGMSREFHVTYTVPDKLIQLQTSLGQYLFNPPNVAGWSGGKNWIDSSSLMLRMKIPSMVLNDGILDFDGKADPEDEALIALNKKDKVIPPKSLINAQANWAMFLSDFPKQMKQAELAAFILAPAPSETVITLVSKNTNLKNTAIAVTSMPEYQLC